MVGKGVEDGCVEMLINMLEFDKYLCDLIKMVCDGKFDLVIGCV